MNPETLPVMPPKRSAPPLQGQRVTEEEWERAKALKVAGHTWAAISGILNIKADTLRCRAHREKLPVLMATVEGDKAVLKATGQEKRINSSLAETSQRVRDLLAIDAENTALRLEQYQPDNLRDEWQREQIAGSLVKRAAATFDWTQAQSQLVLNVGIMSQLPDADQSVIDLSSENPAPEFEV